MEFLTEKLSESVSQTLLLRKTVPRLSPGAEGQARQEESSLKEPGGAYGQEDRDLPIYHLAIVTGMRQGELIGLQWKDVDFDAQSIRVSRQIQRSSGSGSEFVPPKTRAGTRTIMVGDGTMAILREHRNRQLDEINRANGSWANHDLVFPSANGKPMHPTNLLRRFRKLSNEAGLPEIRFHDLRHTAASLMLKKGTSILTVSRRLGHAQPSVTLNEYGHLLPGMQEEAARIMDEISIPVGLPVAPELHLNDRRIPEKSRENA